MSDYDCVIVGAGPAGALVAARLGEAGRRVLVLESGPAAGRTSADHAGNVARFQAAAIKVPNSPYAGRSGAPFLSVGI